MQIHRIGAVMLVAASLAGCARFEAARDCQKEAGGMPNAWTGAFGLVGALANSQTPEFKTYANSVDTCMARYDASVKASN